MLYMDHKYIYIYNSNSQSHSSHSLSFTIVAYLSTSHLIGGGVPARASSGAGFGDSVMIICDSGTKKFGQKHLVLMKMETFGDPDVSGIYRTSLR